ncbi:unnamed protein product, partial [Mesorhabditis spiculigera]
MAVCVGDPPLFDLSSNNTLAFLERLEIFSQSYTSVHRWLCLWICSFGMSAGLYTVTLDELVLADDCLLFKINLWLTGICFKAFPCVLLLWFTCALIHKLYVMSEKRRKLRGQDPPSTTSAEWSTLATYTRKKKVTVDKTTVMLIIMLAVFLCTELPQGLLVILNAIYTNHVHYYVYLNLGEALLN